MRTQACFARRSWQDWVASTKLSITSTQIRILEGDDGRFYFSKEHLDEQALNDADEAPLIEKEKKTGAAEANVAKAKAKAARTAEETPAPIPLAKMAPAVEPRDSDFSDLASTYM